VPIIEADANLRAFLDMIAWSEGTPQVKGSDDGYNVTVGGGLFDSYADHPRRLVKLPRYGLSSTAAGRYQLLEKYYDAYKKLLDLPDFSPMSQDDIAIQQIKERKALPLIQSGDIRGAIQRCANIWASLPGAGYGQRENSLNRLIAEYKSNGGSLA